MEQAKNLFQEKRPIASWSARKILETIDNYEGAVNAFSTTPYPSPQFDIISGVKKGAILARNPDGLAYKLDLGNHRQITVTNFDQIVDGVGIADSRPGFNGGLGQSRQAAAGKILDG